MSRRIGGWDSSAAASVGGADNDGQRAGIGGKHAADQARGDTSQRATLSGPEVKEVD